MLADGLTLLEGSAVVNLVLPSGTAFPLEPDPGELFFRTDQGRLYAYSGGQWVSPEGGGTGGVSAAYDIGISVAGQVAVNTRILNFVTPRPFTIPANFAGSVARAGTSTNSTFTIQRNSISIGTVGFSAGTPLGTFSTQEALTFEAGDMLSILSPAENLPSDLGIVIVATLT